MYSHADEALRVLSIPSLGCSRVKAVCAECASRLAVPVRVFARNKTLRGLSTPSLDWGKPRGDVACYFAIEAGDSLPQRRPEWVAFGVLVVLEVMPLYVCSAVKSFLSGE